LRQLLGCYLLCLLLLLGLLPALLGLPGSSLSNCLFLFSHQLLTDLVSQYLTILGALQRVQTFGSVSTICLLRRCNFGTKACFLQVVYCVYTVHTFCQAKGPLMSRKGGWHNGTLTTQSREEGIAAGLAYARGWQKIVKHMLALIVRSDGCQKITTPESMLWSGAQSLHPLCWPDVGRQGTAGELLEL
jgi:hypothetical protein